MRVSDFSGHDMAGKQSNMATVIGECAAVLCCLLEVAETNEEPSSFRNSCT